MINDPLKYVAVPYAELQSLLAMARTVSQNSPWGQSDTQPWNPTIKQLPELGSEVPTIAGVVGESNTVLISIPDLDSLISMLPTIGNNNNWWINGVDTGVPVFADATMVLRPQILMRAPIVVATSNIDELHIQAGGVITVDDGLGKILKVDIQETTINIATAKMLVVDLAGRVATVDNNYTPVAQAAPLLYINRTAGYVVDVIAEISMAITGTELPYLLNILRTLDSTALQNLLEQLQELQESVTGSVASLEDQLANVNTELSNFLRFDSQQTLTDSQLAQLWANAGIGSTLVDFAAIFNTTINS